MKKIALFLSLIPSIILHGTEPATLTNMEILNASDAVASLQAELNTTIAVANVVISTLESATKNSALPPMTAQDKKNIINLCDTSEKSDLDTSSKKVKNHFREQYQAHCSSPFSPSACTQFKATLDSMDSVFETMRTRLNTTAEAVAQLPEIDITQPKEDNDFARLTQAINTQTEQHVYLGAMLKSIQNQSHLLPSSLSANTQTMLGFSYLTAKWNLHKRVSKELFHWNEAWKASNTPYEDFAKQRANFENSLYSMIREAETLVSHLTQLPSTPPDSPENLMRDMQERIESYQHVLSNLRTINPSEMSSEDRYQTDGELLNIHHFVQEKSQHFEKRFGAFERASSDNPTCAALEEMYSKFTEVSDILSNTVQEIANTSLRESSISQYAKDVEETIQSHKGILTALTDVRSESMSISAEQTEISHSKKRLYRETILKINQDIKNALAGHREKYATIGCATSPDKFPSCSTFSDNLDTLERLTNRMLETNKRTLNAIEAMPIQENIFIKYFNKVRIKWQNRNRDQ